MPELGSITLKQLAAGIGLVAAIAVPGAGALAWLDSVVYTKDQAQILNLQLLIAIDQSRITHLKLHRDELGADELDELAGLEETVKQNECQYNKAIGLYGPAHSCN